jgi:hypothetical protein
MSLRVAMEVDWFLEPTQMRSNFARRCFRFSWARMYVRFTNSPCGMLRGRPGRVFFLIGRRGFADHMMQTAAGNGKLPGQELFTPGVVINGEKLVAVLLAGPGILRRHRQWWRGLLRQLSQIHGACAYRVFTIHGFRTGSVTPGTGYFVYRTLVAS